MLEFKQVSAHYGKIQTLHQVSLNIQKGKLSHSLEQMGLVKPHC